MVASDNKDQLQEMEYYYKLHRMNNYDIDIEHACRNWVRKYARRWRDLKESGIAEPGTILRKEYLIEDQYKWASGRLRRAQSFFPSAIGKTRSFSGLLAEVLKP